jgi:hypothetical protein
LYYLLIIYLWGIQVFILLSEVLYSTQKYHTIACCTVEPELFVSAPDPVCIRFGSGYNTKLFLLKD